MTVDFADVEELRAAAEGTVPGRSAFSARRTPGAEGIEGTDYGKSGAQTPALGLYDTAELSEWAGATPAHRVAETPVWGARTPAYRATEPYTPVWGARTPLYGGGGGADKERDAGGVKREKAGGWGEASGKRVRAGDDFFGK